MNGLHVHVDAHLLEHRGDARAHLAGHERALRLVDEHLESRSLHFLSLGSPVVLRGGGQSSGLSRIALRGRRRIPSLRHSGGSHRGSLVAARSLPACGGSSHGRSLVATCGSFAAGCGCLGRRSGLGLRLRGHQSLGLRERGLRLSLLDRHLLGAEISGNDDRAVVFAVLESFVQLFLAAHLRPGDGRFLAVLRSRRGRDVLDQGIAHVHIALRRLHALVERQNRERQPLHLHIRHRVEHDGHDACRHDADEQRHYVLRFPEFLEHREPPSECVAGA